MTKEEKAINTIFQIAILKNEKEEIKMIKRVYQEVKGIVHKCRKEYYLHLWEVEDWDQEGMICLYELLDEYPEILERNDKRLYIYFKTKFRNRILDAVRKQESQKRRLDRQVYEEVSEISHRLTEGGLRIDESYALQELLKEYQRGLDEEKLDLYERLLADERFKGRRAMLKELSHVLKDFSPSQ